MMTEAIKEKKNGLTAYLKNIKSTFRVKSCINYMVVAGAGILFAVLSLTDQLQRSDQLLLEKITYSVILALSLNLVVGFLGELSLGHAAFMGLGAYIGCYMQHYVYTGLTSASPFVSLLLTMLIGGLVAAVFGFIVGLPALRLKGDYLAIVTLAFGEIVKTIFQNSETFGGAIGLQVKRYPLDYLFMVGFAMVLVTMFVVQNLVRSKQGRAITAIRDDEIAARAMGVNVTYYKLSVFVIAAFFAGVAGVLFGNSQNVFKSNTFDYNYSINILVMVVLGGMGSINGSIIAAVLVSWINTELSKYLSGDLAALQNVIYALVLIGIVIFKNSPKLKKFRDKYNFAALGKLIAGKMAARKAKRGGGKKAAENSLPQEDGFDDAADESGETPALSAAKESVCACEERAENTEDCADGKYMLETKSLSISFGGLSAVKDFSLQIKKHELYGLIGPNGAGKTTVFNLLTGVYKPTSGEFFLNGKSLLGKGQAAINRAGIARTFQNIRIFNDMTVIRNVMVGLENNPLYKCSLFSSVFRTPRYYETVIAMRKKAKELLRVFSLEEERNQMARNLPYGKQRKLEIARALATNPKLLLLDEPAAGMNPYETRELMETIRLVRDKFGVTILLIEHDMKLVSGICDRVTVLNFGVTLAQGETKEVLKAPEVVAAYLGGE